MWLALCVSFSLTPRGQVMADPKLAVGRYQASHFATVGPYPADDGRRHHIVLQPPGHPMASFLQCR